MKAPSITTMNEVLHALAAEMRLADPEHDRLRLAFGHACASRVQSLLEDSAVKACLEQLGRHLRGDGDPAALERARQDADRLANGHPGSTSIDGCGHAAVSASYAVANALQGRALQAADYAAYARVYADGGYAAVAQPEAFELEFKWQAATLNALAAATSQAAVAGPSAACGRATVHAS
jgi:hypothetical protein